ncbi:TonB-dependent receptor family protein [Aerosticca soli]|uniref:Iron transporter n=1 Tax=Aerosticca soli TaxID=2010829 RepID=A0A2Z6E1Y9_9GAMM|nr:TonB-dependent receptor [Aerosticca soli]BBD79045.1 iron transporter [Aerosticca soli]
MLPHGFNAAVPQASTGCRLALAISVLASGVGVARQGDAQDAAPATMPVVQVNASRLRVDPRDVPAALSVVEVNPAQAGQPGVNLSEVLVGVPGVLARDRQNYAQDEQFSIRGFGARSTFGVRSMRLFIDGIPATLPDGQGQVSNFVLNMGGRLEVLRGPFSVLYGNAAGGVVQLWTAQGTAVPQTTLSVYAGSYDSFRYSADMRGMLGSLDYNVAAGQFLSGGYRAHSRVNRQSAHARFGIPLGAQRKLTVVLDRFDQPRAGDPMGLTRAQLDADPRQASPAALQYNTRKSILQNQLGLLYDQVFDDADRLHVAGYFGRRDILQYQSIPKATQANPLQPGGVVAPDTNYGGLDLRLTHDGEFLGRDSEFVFGGGGDAQWQRRRGYQNFVGNALGVKGALRRDEKDDVDNLDVYAQWYWYFAEHWSLLLGMRHDKVHFNEHDFYITAKNPDDSGHVDYSATTPVLGILFHPRDNVQLYASFGRGFETPTYNELGYRSDGQPGLAFNLRASRSLNKEVGAKWQPTTALDVELAAFRADTRDELAVATNQNGRSTYQNVGAARRQGVELSANGTLAPEWQIAVGFTHLQAVFRSGFLTCTTTPCAAPSTPIPSGSRIPGVPENYGSLRLQHGATLGWREGVTLTGIGSVMANDTNTARAAGYGLIGADVTYAFALGASAHLQLSGRIDNLADRRYVGTVIVNDSNGRYYEPGPGRSYMLGAQLTF